MIYDLVDSQNKLQVINTYNIKSAEVEKIQDHFSQLLIEECHNVQYRHFYINKLDSPDFGWNEANLQNWQKWSGSFRPYVQTFGYSEFTQSLQKVNRQMGHQLFIGEHLLNNQVVMCLYTLNHYYVNEVLGDSVEGHRQYVFRLELVGREIRGKFDVAFEVLFKAMEYYSGRTGMSILELFKAGEGEEESGNKTNIGKYFGVGQLEKDKTDLGVDHKKENDEGGESEKTEEKK